MTARPVASVPKGILRLLILRLASKGPMSGMDVIRRIQRDSEGIWTPSPGSIYYLLSELASYGEITEVISTAKGERHYLTTQLGLERLEASATSLRREIRRIIAAVALAIPEEPVGRQLLRISQLALELPNSKQLVSQALADCANRLAHPT